MEAKPVGSGMRKAGVILMVIGAIFFVGGIVAVVGGFSWASNSLTDTLDQGYTGGEEVLFVGGEATVDTQGQQQYWYLWAPESAATETWSCEVEAPNGASQPISLTSALDRDGSGKTYRNGKAYTVIGQFQATQTGEYTVTCKDDRGKVSDAFIETMPSGVHTVALGIFLGITGIIGGGLGFLLLGLGIVLFFVGRSRMRRQLAVGGMPVQYR